MHVPFGRELPAAACDAAATAEWASVGRTRPLLRVQDGCGHRCSFCIIPTTRGPSRSVPLEQALGAARAFGARGGIEMVLTGINLGRWGRDFRPPQRLEDLVGALLQRTELPRLRLSSVEPMDWSEELLGLFARYSVGPVPRLARHAHLPLQSGSDAVLRRMHRRYRPWHYAERVRRIHAVLPAAAIGADVMVGFPGESDAEHEESLRLVDSLPLTYLHLFPYSPRPGTPASQMRPVPEAVVGERMRAFQELARAKASHFRQEQSGRELSAVTLAARSAPGGGTEAVTDNYLRVLVQPALAANRLIRVRIPPASKVHDGAAVRGHGAAVEAELSSNQALALEC